MNAYEAAYKCLKPLGFPVYPDEADGKDDTYITYNYNEEHGDGWGDNTASAVRSTLYVHFVCPYDRNHIGDKKTIRRALVEAGFSFPQVVESNVKEHNLRHVIFETEWIEEI